MTDVVMTFSALTIATQNNKLSTESI